MNVLCTETCTGRSTKLTVFSRFSAWVFLEHYTRKDTSLNLLSVLELFLRTLAVNSVQKVFQLIAASLKSTKRLRDGSFLVECSRRTQAGNLLKKTKKKTVNFVDRPVHVSVHETLNSSRGVIRCRELSDMSEIEIRDELKTQGVVEVHKERGEGNSYQHPVSDVQPTRHTKRNCTWLFEGENGPVCP